MSCLSFLEENFVFLSLPLLYCFQTIVKIFSRKSCRYTFFEKELCTLIFEQVQIVASFAVNTKAASVVYMINAIVSLVCS